MASRNTELIRSWTVPSTSKDECREAGNREEEKKNYELSGGVKHSRRRLNGTSGGE